MGGRAVQQYLGAGLVDELHLNLTGAARRGFRLLDGIGAARTELERTRVVSSVTATHLSYRVVRRPA
jgi:hypothetical protein